MLTRMARLLDPRSCRLRIHLLGDANTCPPMHRRPMQPLQTMGMRTSRRTYLALITGCARASRSAVAYDLYRSRECCASGLAVFVTCRAWRAQLRGAALPPPAEVAAAAAAPRPQR